jgi:hypothetical protein
LVQFSTLGCSTPRGKLQGEEYLRVDSQEDFSKALDDGDSKSVRLYFEAHGEFPFFSDPEWQAKLLVQAVRQGRFEIAKTMLTLGDMKGWAKSAGLDEAIRMAERGEGCQTEMVKLHVQHGARLTYWDRSYGNEHPSPYLMESAAKRLCPDVLAAIIPLAPEMAPGALTAFRQSNENVAGNSSSFWDQENQVAVKRTIALLKGASEARCKSGDDITACRALKEFSGFEASYAKAEQEHATQVQASHEASEAAEREAEKQRKYDASAQGSFDRACRAASNLKLSQRMIASERRNGEVSGVVNKRVLYEWGQRYQGSEMLLREYSAEYKNRSGKTFNPSQCPKQAQAN